MPRTDWTPHRRDDGELLGWIHPDGEAWVPVDILGRTVSGPTEWLDAEAALEERGISWLADPWVLDGEGHLDELAVVPAHGRRGVGRALVDEVLAWTAARGLPSVTLITFRDVPWNGPYYEKLGFEAVTALTPELQAALDQGATWGVKRDLVMRRSLVDAESVDA